MDPKTDQATTLLHQKVSLAVVELAKGIKSVSFYPEGHPALTQSIWKIVTTLEGIPLPETGLELDVTKNALLFQNVPLPASNKAVVDLNRELYHRRVSKMIFLPGQKVEEMTVFLTILNRDIQDIQDEGGLERVLLRGKISRIWANRVDYEGLTEMLKQDELEETSEEELPLKASDLDFGLEETRPEEVTVEALLKKIAEETAPSAYREHVILLSKALLEVPADRRIELSSRALSIFVRHIEHPPEKSEEIAGLARMAIKELANNELVSYYIQRLQDRGARDRSEAERVLEAFGDRAVKALLTALAEEGDLLVRKSIVDIVIRIGRPSLPFLLDNLSDSRWYVVRNIVTIMGSLEIPDLAPHVASVLSHPDLRVKKEAIKALSKIDHPSAVKSLGDLCFFPEETVALTATAALSAKREPEAVMTLYRRVVQRKLFYPHYRLAHEAIDALRNIGTEEALDALEGVLGASAVWETANFRAMKSHALRSISKMGGNRAREIVQKAVRSPKGYLRVEAERAMKRTEG
ncbi:MAG TPA: HEAT repeat domain-containing protein [Candidatus Deferrimicrobiaceae bacterium]